MTTLQTPDPVELPPTRRLLTDRRIAPRGVLPRRLQMWLMVGIAVVILLIILITGHPEPPARETANDRPTTSTLPAPERVRGFQQQLADDESRRRNDQQREATAPKAAAPEPVAASDPNTQRANDSLFADSVVVSRRAPADRPVGAGDASSTPTTTAAPIQSEIDQIENALSRVLSAVAPSGAKAEAPQGAKVGPTPSRQVAPSSPDPTARIEHPAPGERLRMFEGTVIETVLLNRLDGTFAGPVSCLVTTPVYSFDRQHLLIPAGARVLGSASAVQTWGDSRLAVSFHRLLMPDGHTYSLDLFKGLGQVGDAGLRDRVDRHYLQVFGASVAIGGLSGLAQLTTRSANPSGGVARDGFFDATGASLAASTARILDRYLNVLPTVTIREGYRVKVYLTNDFELPPYRTDAGGIR